MIPQLVGLGVGLWFLIILFFNMIKIVPEQEAWVVEEFGKYKSTLGPGFHFVIPIVQKVTYRHLLKEQVVDVPPQVCITKDNVQVTVDGILYLTVVDAVKASYGIDNYRFATAQLAQTTMRSTIGKIVLDKTFSERESLNDIIVKSVDEASDPWGIKVTRYEIKNLDPPGSVIQSMEQQMKAEREKRAEILKSHGDKESRINLSQGDKEDSINRSMAERQRRINESEGRAKSIELIADATAVGITEIADAINQPKGKNAMSMRIMEQYIDQLGNILEESETSILPMDFAQIKGFLQSIMPALAEDKKGGKK